MNTKYTKVLRFLAPAFALTLLSTYVVHSQLTRARNVSPGSKSIALSGTPKGVTSMAPKNNADQTFRVLQNKEGLSPIALELSPAGSIVNQAVSARQPEDWMVAAGSKSAPVFDFRIPPLLNLGSIADQGVSERQLENWMVAASSKSGPVFDFRMPPPGQTARPQGSGKTAAKDTNTVTQVKR